MAAPRIKLFFENGALGQVAVSPDGVLGYCVTGVAVSTTFLLATPYTLKKFDDLATLGVTSTNNPNIVKIFKEFFAEAGDGTEVWVMAFPDTVKLSDQADQTQNYAKKLINAANGRLRGVILSRNPGVGYTPTITNGLDADVALAKTNAQVLAEWATNSKYAPIFTIIEGYAFNGNPIDLTDLTTETKNRTAVFIGDTVASSKNACLGLLGGRIAKNSVKQNIGATEDGALNTLTGFIGAKTVEDTDWESIHDKGYMTLRTWVGRAGYFFNDDPMAALPEDDYNHLTARRTIDKAYRIAYNFFVGKALSAIPVNADGTMQAAMAKSWQKAIEKAVSDGMPGELSVDITKPNDKGVVCVIDPTQNVVSTSRIVVRLRIRPFGYARYIDVYLGFQTVSA